MSLRQKLLRQLTFLSVALVTSVSFITALMLLALLEQQQTQQTEVWETAIPKSLLPHLIEGDQFSVISKVKLAASTGLFKSISVLDRQKRPVAAIPGDQGKNLTVGSDTWTPIKDEAGIIWGYYSATRDYSKLYRGVLIAIILVTVSTFIAFLLVTKLASTTVRKELDELSQFISEVEDISTQISSAQNKATLKIDLPAIAAGFDHSEEQRSLREAVNRLIAEIQQRGKDIIEFARQAETERTNRELAKTAAQVAHDIRSPLMALEMVVGSFSDLPEERRAIVKIAVGRIKDIANNLLEQRRRAIKLGGQTSLHLLLGVVDSILAEKRAEYGSQEGVIIDLVINDGCHGLFARLDPVELKRILSNLINNSIEALAYKGSVTVTLGLEKESAFIAVADNGPGIPSAIMRVLGKEVISYGKSSGSGLGVLHAKDNLEKWGGRIAFESMEGKGTTIQLFFSLGHSPSWYVPSLQVQPGSTVVILDDDPSIHKVWDFRFAALLEKKIIKLEHHKTCASFSDALLGSGERNSLCLVDYELVGSSSTGLDLIEKLKIESSSVLVTSSYDAEAIQNRIRSGKIRMLPKAAAPFVPIIII